MPRMRHMELSFRDCEITMELFRDYGWSNSRHVQSDHALKYAKCFVVNELGK